MSIYSLISSQVSVNLFNYKPYTFKEDEKSLGSYACLREGSQRYYGTYMVESD